MSVEKEVPTVMVAGKTRQGKSTALNNIFGVKFEAYLSYDSVTTAITIKTVEIKSVTMKIIDTPGLEALDIKTEDVLANLKKQKIDQCKVTLLYCIAVGPSNQVSKLDEAIVINIQKIFGEGIWNRCLLVLSFSDHVVHDNFPKVMEDDMHLVPYLAHLRGHAERFHGILRKCGAKIPGVMLLFDYEMGKYDESKSDQLVAVPAAKDKYFHETNILPGIVKYGDNVQWTDYVYREIIKKVTEPERHAYIQIKYGCWEWKDFVIPAVAGGVAGGGTGAVAAAKVGVAMAGGVVATAAGAVVGSVGVTVVVAWGIIRAYRKKETEKKETEKKLKEKIESKKDN